MENENSAETFSKTRFLNDYLRDRETVRSLSEYLSRHPGHELEIAEAFVTLNRGQGEVEKGARTDLHGILGIGHGWVGPYRTMKLLGRGGQGEVFLAEDARLRRKVALKVLTKLGPVSGDILVRFRREAELASKLNHPHLCTVYDTGIDRDMPYIAMQYVEGSTLANLIAAAKQEGRKSVLVSGDPSRTRSAAEPAHGIYLTGAQSSTRRELMSIVHLIEKSARALQAAHDAGIVHRDIKPANIMVTRDEDPVILDFGVARDLDSDVHTLTQSGELFGSPAYMAPEQLTGKRTKLDRRTDVYALGVTLYEGLTLRRPFEAPTLEAIYHAITSKDPPDPREINPAIPVDLRVVIETALEKDRDRRYRSAREFADDLRRVREYRPIKARPPSAAVRFERWVQRNPITSSFSVALFVVLGIALTVSLFLLDRMNTEKNAKDAALTRARNLLVEKEVVLAELERLADVKSVRDLDGWADRLWPVRPELVRQKKGIDAWLAEADTLRERLAEYESSLALLRSRAVQPGRPDGSDWVFEAAGDAWRHENLTELVKRIKALPPRMAEMQTRRERALTLRERSIENHQAEWDRTAAALRDTKQYPGFGGLRLKPQLGLVPLGPDPKSKLFEFAHLPSGEAPIRDDRGQLVLTEDTGLVLVLVPGGPYVMGAVRSARGPSDRVPVDRQAATDENPVQRGTIAPFFLAKYEMNQAQWKRLAGENPSYWLPGKRPGGIPVTLQHPVEQVSWRAGYEALRRLGLRFPAESEWEYACRAGTRTPWSTGDRPTTLIGHTNLADEGSSPYFSVDVNYEKGLFDGYVAHAPVGTYRPNAFGLHDMHGNVWEWCEDGYAPYSTSSRTPPTAAPRYRVYRGGGCYDVAFRARSAVRGHDTPEYRDLNLGLRPAKAIEW